MGKSPYLIRRPSGVYVVRLVVPEALRRVAGQTEVHRSTGCRDLALAKIVAGERSARWHERVATLKGMDLKKLQTGSAGLLGDDTVALVRGVERLGAQPVELVARLLARGAAPAGP